MSWLKSCVNEDWWMTAARRGRQCRRRKDGGAEAAAGSARLLAHRLPLKPVPLLLPERPQGKWSPLGRGSQLQVKVKS